ncbi:hypothetical protein HPB52_005404 [Rhipicephalus sanguineus]|uniref:Uncharacterized protein n=1 Tax=Rhipicephalus sanguineus TaxID=34632 RepID=A0A9D4Q9Z1_RHISA|nr:hypothetical protein HPB52_005404 [Rhipicephalus sanguineus]
MERLAVKILALRKEDQENGERECDGGNLEIGVKENTHGASTSEEARQDTAPKANTEIDAGGDQKTDDKVGAGFVLVDFQDDDDGVRELDGPTEDRGGREAKDGKAEKTRKRRKRKEKRNHDEQYGGEEREPKKRTVAGENEDGKEDANACEADCESDETHHDNYKDTDKDADSGDKESDAEEKTDGENEPMKRRSPVFNDYHVKEWSPPRREWSWRLQRKNTTQRNVYDNGTSTSQQRTRSPKPFPKPTVMTTE